MKSKDRKDIFTKSEKELKKLLVETRENLFNLTLDLSQNKLKNTRSIFWKRKEIALILTAIQQKEIEAKEIAK